jgi:transposase-like protein
MRPIRRADPLDTSFETDTQPGSVVQAVRPSPNAENTSSLLCKDWEAEHARFRRRSLRFHRYADLFVDGVHVSVRLGEDDRLCLLVVIGVREDGVKELLAVEDG